MYHSHGGIFFSVSRQIGPVLYSIDIGALSLELKRSECDIGYLTPEVGGSRSGCAGPIGRMQCEGGNERLQRTGSCCALRCYLDVCLK